MTVSRRRFLTYAGMGTYAMLTGAVTGCSDVSFPGTQKKGKPPAFFSPISASNQDDFLVPEGFDTDIIAKWGDPLGTQGPLGAETFGFNNDFLAYFPIDALEGGDNAAEGLLWVNHEYPDSYFVSGTTNSKKKKTQKQILAEKQCVGGSVIHVQKKDGKWKHVPGHAQTRRFTASYPKMKVTGPAGDVLQSAIGTLANCSGGRTLWNTVLTCEENYHNYNAAGGHRWGDVPKEKLDLRQYGWVTEIDPFGKLPPRKHSALGRFAHENAAMTLGDKGHLVVYMGDDAADQYLYKFVSAEKHNPKASRAEQRKLLSEGTLYVANLRSCRWLPLDLKRSPALKEANFKSQADVVMNARLASKALGATPLDRPEDCEVHPKDRTLYVALTNNSKHGNYFGQILRLIEDKGNPESERFRFEIFHAGGPKSGMACPDNLVFDKAGNLWVTCDVSTSAMHQRPYKTFGNNGLFVIPTSGPSAGDAYQFASAPVDAEITGPWFNENQDTLFVSVQHPGENSTPKKLTSHWPNGGNEIPRPAVVAIRGKFE